MAETTETRTDPLSGTVWTKAAAKFEDAILGLAAEKILAAILTALYAFLTAIYRSPKALGIAEIVVGVFATAFLLIFLVASRPHIVGRLAIACYGFMFGLVVGRLVGAVILAIFGLQVVAYLVVPICGILFALNAREFLGF